MGRRRTKSDRIAATVDRVIAEAQYAANASEMGKMFHDIDAAGKAARERVDRGEGDYDRIGRGLPPLPRGRS